MKPNFRLYHSGNKTINEINQSKEYDTSYNQIEKNHQQKSENLETQEANKLQLESLSSNKFERKQETKLQSYKKYSTNQQTKTKYMLKNTNYNSGKFNSTQAASPTYNRISTQDQFKQDLKTQLSPYTVKKQLFLSEKSQQSPQFKLNQSKFESFTMTFKKKVDQYPRIFGQKQLAQKLLTFIPQNTNQKINFERINFSNFSKPSTSKQNNPSELNKDQANLSNIKKKINFQKVDFLEQNPIIKQINEEIRKDQLQFNEMDRDYKISRRNQRDLVKKKILQSRSDLKRFYEDNSQNVQYEYRKSKFMDIFLGSKTLQSSIR